MTDAVPETHPLAQPLQGLWTLVHGPLAHWAEQRPHTLALQTETHSYTFAQLHAEVERRADNLIAHQAPAMVLLDADQSTLERVVGFLAIIRSGRCAAVADPDWPAAVRQRIESWLPTTPCSISQASATSPFYAGFTSGSTGLPKGFVRHHRSWTESFRVSLQDFGAVAGLRTLAPGRISHSLFLFAAVQALWNGSGAVLQEKFSAARGLATLALGETPCLVAVPSQLLLMLQWAAHRQLPPIAAVKLITISGARWMRSHTAALRRLFPQARIIEFYGASEASFITWLDADESCSPQAVGRPFSNVELDIRPLSARSADLDTACVSHPSLDGLIYVRSPMLFIDYMGDAQDRTGVLRDGPWLSVRDIGHIDERGMLCLAGRQSRMIVTQGKNLFPEEVENLLQSHPQIAHASLHGQNDALRGMQVHAVIQWHETGKAQPSALELGQWLRERMEAFKAPRHWWIAGDWPQTASGKTDHARLGQALAARLAGQTASVELMPWQT
ncbi:AMP-binding protein [Comamonas aquatilis]|uniref:AMP-binding protein n=1 Tax=Comamonas aquatilis TaxID=1778406 RepID=UPI0039EDFA43